MTALKVDDKGVGRPFFNNSAIFSDQKQNEPK